MTDPSLAETRPQTRHLSRGIDYLGNLGAKLRDLRGFATLAHELIQNADDAEGASYISFDMRTEALLVDNDGIFTDCGNVEGNECLWKELKGHLCDFHRFRTVASGDKREQEGMTGAFGIGFIAVYQITDNPELISSGRHWIIHEDQPENQRIEVCNSCRACQHSNLPRTRFILPWAADPDSFLRQALRVEAVQKDAPMLLLEELERSIPTAMLFLKKVNRIDIKNDGSLVRSIERIVEEDSLIINDGERDSIWHLFYGDFDEEAAKLRELHPGRIEGKRSADVTLAIPDEPTEKGLFCAYLPTKHGSGLPFHLNADFFPTNDRKGIILEADYQSEWNRAAILAGAEILQENFGQLPKLIDHQRLWKLIERVHHASQEAKEEKREQSLRYFWEYLSTRLQDSRVVFTTSADWKNPQEVLLFEKEEEEEAIPLLEGLDISLVHSDLRPYFTLLRSSDIGVGLLDATDITEVLKGNGLTERTELSAFPSSLQTEGAFEVLWREIDLLFKRRRRSEDQAAIEQEVAECAIAPGRDGAMWPCLEICRADEETIDLFSKIDPDIPFISKQAESVDVLGKLCPLFSADTALFRIEQIGDGELEKAWNESRFDPARLLLWFENRRLDVLDSSDLTDKLSALPIFPSSSGLRPLSQLALPGDFNDPIGFTELVNLDLLGDRREFLLDLGATRLTFKRYVSDHVPSALSDEDVPNSNKRKLVGLLSSRLGEIRDDSTIRESLCSVPIVECMDGFFRQPRSVYLDKKETIEVLGNWINIAVTPPDHKSAAEELYLWLGVAKNPRFEDIVERVEELVGKPPTTQTVDAIGKIFRHMAVRLDRLEEAPEELSELKLLAWLPARDDYSRWYLPQDLYTVFRYYLFKSQARFLALPHDTQKISGKLFEFLGIDTEPGVHQVVGHLLECSKAGTEVNREVYIFLNNNAQDSALAKLGDQACILLPDGKYVKANQIFWSEHPFGRFRYRLGSELLRYADLFWRLNVRDIPDYTDALKVIKEISSEYGSINKSLDEDAYKVIIECWRMLERAIENEAINREEISALCDQKLIPDALKVLTPAKWMYFEDRAGLAEKFGPVLQRNVITRIAGVWQAMEAAGVRSLRSSVKVHLVECTDPIEDGTVTSRIQDRHLQLFRVIESQTDIAGVDSIQPFLKELKCIVVQELKIRYHLKAYNRDLLTGPEEVFAHYHRDDSCLYFVRRNEKPSWAPIARELALALCPDIEPGRLASGFKEVLSAETEEDAKFILDELGYSSLDIGPTDMPAVGDQVQELGGQQIPDDEALETELGVSELQQGIDGTQPGTAKEAINAILGSDSPSPEAPAPEEAIKEFGGSATGATAGKASAGALKGASRLSKTRQKGKLRTYVIPAGKKTEDKEIKDTSERNPVDQAGVKKVLDFEKQNGRFANEMPFTHPGYDIESKDSTGKVIRYIEVKSLSGDWGSLGTALSKPQFDKAVELRDAYWLYVVERAEQDDFKIHKIQDPASRVNQFIYDDGWKNLATDDIFENNEK